MSGKEVAEPKPAPERIVPPVGLPTTTRLANKRLVAGLCSIVGHPSVATSVQGESLGCDLLAQEVLGFGFFVVPLLQLLGTKEADDSLTNRVAICNNLADYVAFGRIGILLHVLCDLFSCFRKSDAKLFLLIVGEVQVASETLQFGRHLFAFF